MKLILLKFLNKLPQEEITAMAKTYVDGFHEGFIINNIDMSQNEVLISIIRSDLNQLSERQFVYSRNGLAPLIIYRSGVSVLTRGLHKIGYVSSSPNPQYEYDHRYDQAIFFDNRFMKPKLECYHNAYEHYKDEICVCWTSLHETFGEIPFYQRIKKRI